MTGDGCRDINAPGSLVLLLGDAQPGDVDALDEGEAQVAHEELDELGLGHVRRRQVEPEVAHAEVASVDEGDLGVEAGAEIRHVVLTLVLRLMSPTTTAARASTAGMMRFGPASTSRPIVSTVETTAIHQPRLQVARSRMAATMPMA